MLPGEQAVKDMCGFAALLLRDMSKSITEDEEFRSGLECFAETLEFACTDFETLSDDAKLLLGVLALWFEDGQRGLDWATKALIAAIRHRAGIVKE
jgi:hypothetical protein